jgi:hypothetical protein
MLQTPRILFICGSLNQTTMMHKIAQQVPEFEHFFTPYYSDGFIDILARNGLLDFSILGGEFRRQTEEYLHNNSLSIDYRGAAHTYDLVLTCCDLLVPKNIRTKRLILVQEGMTDPENMAYYLVKWLKLPRYLASTSTTGLSDAYNVFCVASEGYREHFIRKGVKSHKLVVTGIPNFDNCAEWLTNDFPYKNYVLVATSDSRETFKLENRRKFIEQAVAIAAGRPLIFKLHPNELVDRATAEINRYAPGALVIPRGNINPMIANCDTLVTRFSTVVYVGIALGKEVYSEFNLDSLHKLAPIQNGGTSAVNIAAVCRDLFYRTSVHPSRTPERTLMDTLIQSPTLAPMVRLFSKEKFAS